MGGKEDPELGGVGGAGEWMHYCAIMHVLPKKNWGGGPDPREKNTGSFLVGKPLAPSNGAKKSLWGNTQSQVRNPTVGHKPRICVMSGGVTNWSDKDQPDLLLCL